MRDRRPWFTVGGCGGIASSGLLIAYAVGAFTWGLMENRAGPNALWVPAVGVLLATSFTLYALGFRGAAGTVRIKNAGAYLSLGATSAAVFGLGNVLSARIYECRPVPVDVSPKGIFAPPGRMPPAGSEMGAAAVLIGLLGMTAFLVIAAPLLYRIRFLGKRSLPVFASYAFVGAAVALVLVIVIQHSYVVVAGVIGLMLAAAAFLASGGFPPGCRPSPRRDSPGPDAGALGLPPVTL